MILQEIKREHILKALSEIDREGVPDKHESTMWDLVFGGNVYPPKWAIRTAGKYALGEEYSDKLFSGGPETNGFLESRGFTVLPKRSAYSAHSWTVENNNWAYKVLDKSAFLHRGTGIPKEIRSFFLKDELSFRERKTISLSCLGNTYTAHLVMEGQDTARTRLFWNADFTSLLKETFPHHYQLYSNNQTPDAQVILRLKRTYGYESYDVSFAGEISEKSLNLDIQAEDIEENGPPQKEGRVVEYYGKRYERSAVNRQQAIKIHGLSCNACGFNFEKAYGARGADYIEVHHIKPIHTYEEAQHVDPKTDLITVCSNCHRMMHRDSSNVLRLNDMRDLISKVKGADSE